MRIVFGVLVVTATACGSDEGGMFPVGGGGNDGGFTQPDGRRSDASPDGVTGTDAMVAPIDANEMMGRVCLLTDPRKMDVCASTGAAGLTVRLGTGTATTAADGTFTIPGQSGTGLVWRITGPNIVSSFEVLADYQIPAITRTAFSAMMSGSTPSVMQVPGEGSMMVFVSRNGAGVSGVTAETVPEAFYKPFYDGASASAWQQTSTGADGAVWVPGIDVGSVTVTVSNVKVTAPIFDDGITFANIILP